MAPPAIASRVRFWRMLAPAIGAPHECWIWPGRVDSDGYGTLAGDGRGSSPTRVARLSYELNVGPIPEGFTIDHVAARGCTSRACCNPSHLEAVTNATNVLRGSGFSAVNARKTHCPAGHPYSGENLYVKPSGKRVCRECRREGDRRRYAAETG